MTSHGATSHDGLALDESDQEESSEPSSIEHQLDRFRDDWKNELEEKSESNPDEIEKRAKELFLRGAYLEQQGSVFEAVIYYRQAVKLVPDIEFKIEELREPQLEGDRHRTVSETSVDSVGEVFECEDLVAHFSQLRVSANAICLKQYEQTATHISVLPAELLQYILRWVISMSLDMRSLEMFSTVCRGFYVMARDPVIWKMACSQIWRRKNLYLPKKFPSWRDMYLLKERLLFDGVYISRASYFKHVEIEFGYNDHNGWRVVVFYRYARFFPDGSVIMFTSPEEPVQVLSKCRDNRVQLEGLQYGHYTIKGDEVQAIVKYKKRQEVKSKNVFKRNKPQYDFDAGENTFHASFTLKSDMHKGTSRLVWKDYCVVTKYRNDVPYVNQFSVDDGQHPPLHFSRVLSYTADMEDILDFHHNTAR